MADDIKKHHISSNERIRWDKTAEDLKTANNRIDALFNEIAKIRIEMKNMYDQIQKDIAVSDVDKVDGRHGDNTANNLPTLNSAARLTRDTEGAAFNIPTRNVGGNIWIE